MADVESTESRTASSDHFQAQSLASLSVGSPPSASSMSKPKFRRRADPEYNIFDRMVLPPTDKYRLKMVHGVMQVYDAREASIETDPQLDVTSETAQLPQSRFPVPSFAEYVADLWAVKKTAFSGAISSFCFNRLEILAAKFHLHILLNGQTEYMAQKSVPHRDFYNVRKVDTHVHHSAAMNLKHLLRFIKHKLKFSSGKRVICQTKLKMIDLLIVLFLYF
jgi:AMP deaminase